MLWTIVRFGCDSGNLSDTKAALVRVGALPRASMPQEAPCPLIPHPTGPRPHQPSDDTIVIELVEPADMPAVVRIVWLSAPTITTPAKLNEVAAEAMKILAYASTRYAQIRAQRRC